MRRLDERNKGVIFKNCAPFTNCINEINHTQIDNANYIIVKVPMYNLTEYSDNYSKTLGRLWQYCKDEPNDNITKSESFEYKIEILAHKDVGNTKDVKIAVPWNIM